MRARDKSRLPLVTGHGRRPVVTDTLVKELVKWQKEGSAEGRAPTIEEMKAQAVFLATENNTPYAGSVLHCAH